MKRTLFSLWIMVTAALLFSVGGSFWIGGENNVLASVLLIAAFALFVTGIFAYTREEQRRAQEVTHPAWWIHKLVNLVLNAFAAFFFLYLLFRDFTFALSAAGALSVIGCFKIFLDRKRLSKASAQP